jgi:hypothetical protein
MQSLPMVKRAPLESFELKEVDEISRLCIQVSHNGGKPLARMVSRRKSHEIESKVFLKSTLMKTDRILRVDRWFRSSLVDRNVCIS